MQKFRLSPVWAFLLILTGWISPEAAQTAENFCASQLETQLEVTVEAETPLTKEALALVTTRDGTLKELLEEIVPPRALQEWKRRRDEREGRHGSRYADLRWDDLDFEVQSAILSNIYRRRRLKESSERTIPALIPRRNYRPSSPWSILLFGQELRPVEGEVDLTPLFHGPIEFIMGESAGFEFHLRFPLDAVEMYQETRRFMTWAGIKEAGLHLHVTSVFPEDSLQEQPDLMPAVLALLWATLNFDAEIFTLLEDRVSIRKDVDPGTGFDYFAPLSSKVLEKFWSHLMKVAKDWSYFVDLNSFKMCWIGAWLPGKYDDSKLWGIEVRAIDLQTPAARIERVLARAQAQFRQAGSPAFRKRIRLWLDELKASGSSIHAWMQSGYHFHEYPGISLKVAPQAIRDELKRLYPEEFNTRHHDFDEPPSWWAWLAEHREIQILFFDWSTHPLVFDDSRLREAVRREQIAAIRKLARAERYSLSIVQGFLKKSGLRDQVRALLEEEIPVGGSR